MLSVRDRVKGQMGALWSGPEQTRSDETGFADYVSDSMGDSPTETATEKAEAEEESLEDSRERYQQSLEYQTPLATRS